MSTTWDRNWTDEEVTRARKLQADGVSIGAIAERLGRSENAVSVHLRRRPPGTAGRWNDEDTTTARQMHALGFPIAEIAAKLDRSPEAVRERLRLIRLKERFADKRNGIENFLPREHANRAQFFVPSATALLEREHAMAAPRTLTAELTGDPLPGRSALDRINARIDREIQAGIRQPISVAPVVSHEPEEPTNPGSFGNSRGWGDANRPEDCGHV